MDERFYGTWLVQVVEHSHLVPSSFLVIGSDNADGTFPAASAGAVEVSGEGWRIVLQARSLHLDGRWDSVPAQHSARYTTTVGLVRTVANPGLLTVSCQNQDPELNPGIPLDATFDYTITDAHLVQRHHG